MNLEGAYFWFVALQFFRYIMTKMLKLNHFQILVSNLDKEKLEVCVSSLFCKRHPAFANQLRRNPALLAAVLLSCVHRYHGDSINGPCTSAMGRAVMITEVVATQLPGFGEEDDEVRILLDALFQLAEGEERNLLIHGFDLLVCLFIFC